jgi:transcriptional regulator
MTMQHLAHEYVAWAKQKLDEIDATLATLENSVGALEKDARTQAERAIARIRTARDAFKAKVDAAVRSDLAAAEAITKEAQVGIEAEWTEVELAFQDFLAAAASHASIVKKALTARAEAQRQGLAVHPAGRPSDRDGRD